MKYILLVCFVFISIFSRSQDVNYDIQLNVEGFPDTVAYLGYQFGEKKYLLDTSEVLDHGEIRFSSDKEITSGVYFLYSKGFYMEFLVDEKEFQISTSTNDIYGDMKVQNSPSNEAFRGFQMEMVSHQKKINDLKVTLDSTSTLADSSAVFAQVAELNLQNREIRDSLKSTHRTNLVGQILEMMDLSSSPTFSSDSLSNEEMRSEYNEFRKHYFDGIDFQSAATIRTPLFHSKMIDYVDKVTIQNPDSIIASVDDLLSRAEGNDELYRYIMVVIFQKYQNPKIMGMDKVFVHLSDEYYLKGKASWADSTMISELRDEMKFHRENQLGMQAPYMALVDTLDRPVRLYHVKSDYTVLYFYSPTCGHCKKKTPVLKEVYDRMAGKMEVVAVCTDTDVKKWKQFIKDLDLNWLNYADPHVRSNFRVQYNVRSTPTVYILDKDKKIIGKNLDVEQLEDFINDQIRVSESRKS